MSLAYIPKSPDPTAFMFSAMPCDAENRSVPAGLCGSVALWNPGGPVGRYWRDVTLAAWTVFRI